MNMQAILRQAQKLQKGMMEEKEKLNKTVYEATSSMVKIKMTGDRKVVEVKIDAEEIEKEDIEMLEDMILLAVNEVNKKIDEDTEKNLGKYTQGMPGIF